MFFQRRSIGRMPYHSRYGEFCAIKMREEYHEFESIFRLLKIIIGLVLNADQMAGLDTSCHEFVSGTFP